MNDLNILVCFKVVPNVDMIPEKDWVVEDNLSVNTDYVQKSINCFDESAIEMVLKLSDMSESFNTISHISALTIGDVKTESYLKTLLSMKFNKAVRIDNDDKDIRFKAELISSIISEYVKNYSKQDLILMGNQSGEGDNSKVPLLTSELLGWPCITNVISVEYFSSNFIKVINTMDEGIQTQVIKLPCVLSVGNAVNTYMRVPTLKDKIKYGNRAIEVYKMDQMLFDNEIYSELISLSVIQNNRKAIIIDCGTSKEKAAELYKKHLKKRIENL